MPQFRYSAFTAQGESSKGIVNATSKAEAMRELEAQRLFVDSISAPLLSKSRTPKVKPKEFLGFNKQLISLVKAGMPLVESLSIAGKRSDNQGFATVLGSVEQDLRNGIAFADSCERHPAIFDEIFRSSVRTAEKSGDLHQALNGYQTYLSRRIEFQSTLKKAIAYPVFLIFTLIIVLAFLFIFIVPSFSELFDSFNAELPLATQVVMGLAEVFPAIALIFLLIFFAGALALAAGRDSVEFQRKVDSVRLRIPLVGSIVEQNRSSQLARNVSAMLRAGMPLVSALENIEGTFHKTAIGPKLESVRLQVLDGVAFNKAMRSKNLMSEQAARLVEAGESAGDLGGMLAEVAEYYETDLTDRLAVIMSLFEPVLMLLIGFVVGGIIVSMYLPIFYLAEVVQ